MSLRWQALIALSLVLLVVNGTLAFMAYRQSSAQFDLQQSGVRANQVRQLRGLLGRNYEEMTRLVSVVPLLGPDPASHQAPNFDERLRRGLESDGALLGLEWDVRSVYWITPAGRAALVWPADAQAPGAELIVALTGKDDSVTQVLACQPECLQFLAAPVLWQGRSAGTLVLGRSLADALLAFNALTAAEVAVFNTSAEASVDAPPHFPAMTHPSRTAPIIRTLAPALAGSSGRGQRVLGELGGQWFEVFRVDDLAPGVAALVVDEVTAERQAIRTATRISILLGLGGLILSGSLLFWLAQSSVGRLRRIVAALPLLADNRYAELRSSLPPVGGRLTPTDELDHLSETAQTLTDRMEQLQRDREEAEARLVWLADHDPLTRLYNRRRFNEDFGRVLDQAQRFGHRGALLFLDLDQFKDVNDLSGHQVGDGMLQRVAEQLSTLTHPSDILARLGGDEFALVLPECTDADALVCAERVQAAVRSIQVRENGRVHRVTASIGIALFPDQGQEPQEILANADLAMFQAKDKGRGRWHLFSAEDQAREQADARVTWRDKIAEGLRDERFELHFQPIVAVATGVIEHWEALLRLRDIRGELVYPDRFIPVAEKTGQIQAIDHWVLTQAVRLLARDPRLRLSINLSGGAMDDPALLPDIERLLAEQRVAPTRLTFEVTETVAVASIARANQLMQAIQQLGCRFALDDFGSGYASYVYLRRLPVDDIKIDGTFIRDLATNREDRIFVKAITDMAHGMGKRVTAEFVESAAIYAVLGELGVDCAQGYFLGRPTLIAEHGPWPRAAVYGPR
ncbi:EAL domain-containing protein [uncultured Thiodictyon sp.]|uniref:putative bifunctional diguanylate cyclase/phosphodiesterase n=1 Tax=uncultured Thiodictyon sp. TaxID=1846217 RepID=UPI0025D7E41D|nr:EAL domain-containing protein [uncultured Thiodictyon sp.]